MEISLNVSNAYLNKELKAGYTDAAKSYSFKRATMNLSAITAHIANGGAFTPAYFSESRRKGKLWCSAQIIGVDIDNKSGKQPDAAAIAAMPFVRDYAYYIYPTASSTPQKPKTRILFVLDEVITSPGAWQALICGVLSELAELEPDTACTDLPRYFAGSTQPGHILLGNLLPLSIAGSLTIGEAQSDYQAYQTSLLRRQEAPQQAVTLSSTDAERITATCVNKAIATLATTTHDRHAALIKTAGYLGGMVKGQGWTLTESDARRYLMDACMANGYIAKVGESEVQRCINDMLESAESKNFEPRHKPTATHKPATTQTVKKSAIKADLVLNTPYISDHADKLPKTGVIVIVSATATGKSTLNKKLSEDKSTLVIAPLKSLTNNAANNQEIEYYESIPHEYRSSVRRMAICLPSLKRFASELPDQFPKYDVLQLDEFSRNLEMFGSREIFPDNDATIVMSVQEKLIKNTPLVMVTDAYITQVEIEYLKTIRPDVFIVVNDYRRNYGKLVVYPEREQLQSNLEKDINSRKGAVVFVSTSKAEIERYTQLFEQKYGKDAVISIHSGNATNKRQREFLKIVGDSSTDAARQAAQAEIERYACILASPSLLTGFDIQPTVYRVYGNLFANEIDAAGCMQLLHRYRNAEETHVWIEPKERNLSTTAETIYNRYRVASERTAQLVRINDEDNQPDFDGIVERQLRLQSKIEARRNQSINNLYESFLELAKPHYQIEMVSTDAPAANLNELKEASEAVKARFKELVLTVEPVSPEMHRDRSERGIRTDEDNAGLERWHIERLYRQTITEDLYTLYAGGKGATELHAYIDVMLKSETDLKAHDRQQIAEGVPIHMRDHRAMKSRTIKRVILAVFGQRRNLTAEYLLTANDIAERFTNYSELHPDLIEDLNLYCGLGRNDVSRQPMTIVKRVVRMLGLALRKEERPPKDRPANYALDGQGLELMQRLAQIRLDAIAAEKDDAELNTKYKRIPATPIVIHDTVAPTAESEAQAAFDALPSAFKPTNPKPYQKGKNPNPFARPEREVA